MVNRIRASDHRGLNKGHGSKFHVGSRVQQETPEEGRWTHQPKRCEYNYKDEDNSPKTLNYKSLLTFVMMKFTCLCDDEGRKCRESGISLVIYMYNVYIYIYILSVKSIWLRSQVFISLPIIFNETR